MSSGSLTEALRETLGLFRGSGAPLTTTEAADRLDLGRRSTYERLERLVDHGELATKSVGANGRVWWRPRPETLESELSDVFDRISDGFYGLDGELRFTYVNDRAEDLLGVDEAAVLGRDVRDAVPLTDDFEAALLDAIDAGEPAFLEDYYEPLDGWFDNAIYPSETGLSVYFRDVTDRRERERRLEESEQRYRTLVDNFPNGAVALYDEECHYVAVGGQMYDRIALSPEDAVGMTVGERLSGEIVEALETTIERAFSGETEEVEATYDGRDFRLQSLPIRDDDGAVILAMVVTQDVTERKEADEALERQREQLAALNNLHDTVRGITEAVIEQSTREEIEETVCERLAESGSYSFAWIGDVDVKTRTVNPRAEAGAEGYLDDVTISVDPDDERSRGPTGRAALEREVQVVRDVESESAHDPWREHVRARPFESSAAIPIVHEETLYGVLNVYAPRPNAFDDDERAVIDQLGEVVGHAIAAIERQRALLSDEVVELEFQIDDIFGAIGVPVETDGTITLGRAVPVGDGTFLEYGTATGDSIEAIETVVEDPEVPMWKSVNVLRTDGETTHFELAMVEPPVLSTVTSNGGYFDVAWIEDGDYYMRVHLPPSSSVRLVVDAIMEAYPGVKLVNLRQVEGDRGSVGGVRSTFIEALTERQRAALEAGYLAGYFEWPRETKGEAVAESLGISPATYHQHLRAGQRKLLASALDDPTPT